ncbi:MAG: ABC transporter permease [Anaerolineae bacterium]|nr:MAG: ABC transporter permease [Anaerolineae bacterium]
MRGKPSLRSKLSIVLATAKMRLSLVSRYKGQLFIEILIPIIFAALPIMLGRATGGDAAAANFELNTGTPDYAAYMLIGSVTFMIVSFAFWLVGYWIRFEQETGTLEAIYLTPTSRFWNAAGISLYSAARSLTSGILAYFIGALIFGINPFKGALLLALAFILVGLIPLFGMTLLFGALVMKVREANSLVNMMQWGVSLLMGVFFPIIVFPPLMRALALAFPPTWMVNGVRSSLLGVGYFFGEWYLDFAVLWGFMLIAPLLGYQVFRRVERGIKRNEGVGQY